MKVVHVQNSSKSAGGAAVRLHNAFLEKGVDSYVLTLHDDVNDTDRFTYCGPNAKRFSKIEERIQSFITRNCRKDLGLFTFPCFGADITRNRHIREADVIYLHWVHKGLLNFRSYKKLGSLGKPVIIFMHDMWSITGGCHYSFTCEKYKVKCTDCPFFEGHKFSDLSDRGFKIKRKIYSKNANFNFVSPSKWLQECADNASLTGRRTIYLIPNVLDNRIFKIIEKRAAREVFGINENDLVVSFGAVNIDSPYKGWEYLQKALHLLKNSFSDKKLTILVFGKCNNRTLSELIPFNTIFTGFLKDDYSTSLVYNASDVFVTPSLADNLPTTVLESLSCGTAVVGFNTGGIPDMIYHKKNGYIANYKDADDLAEGIKYCILNKVKGETLPEFRKEKILYQHQALIKKITNKDLF